MYSLAEFFPLLGKKVSVVRWNAFFMVIVRSPDTCTLGLHLDADVLVH